MKVFYVLLFAVFAWSCIAQAQPNDLEQLLQQTKQYQSNEKALYRQREQQFLAQRDQQKQLLNQAQAEFLQAQQKNNPQQKQSDALAEQIAALQVQLDQQVQGLGDIYNVYAEFAADFIAHLQNSLVQAQLPNRVEKLQEMKEQTALATVDDMRELWILLQEEMTKAGQIGHFQAQVTQPSGERKVDTVHRIGTFSLQDTKQLLLYQSVLHELIVQQNQAGNIASVAKAFSKPSNAEFKLVVIDPSHGSLLGLLEQSPRLQERIAQGGSVGYVILALGLAGLLLAVYRIAYLLLVRRKVNAQLKNLAQLKSNNPLGRILQSAQGLSLQDEQALQLALNDAVLKELPTLEQGQSLLKLIAAIAPLLGLLGTVVGMIATFQSISLFGSGDPQLMAGGISQALVTTVEGLVVAIPIYFAITLLLVLAVV